MSRSAEGSFIWMTIPANCRRKGKVLTAIIRVRQTSLVELRLGNVCVAIPELAAR